MLMKCSSLLLMLILFRLNRADDLNVKPAAISGKIKENVIVGESVLNDPERFVWGASVIKGDDGKYHMFYSTWEHGDSLPPFKDSWLLCSKIAYAVSDYPYKDYKFIKIVLKGRREEGDSSAWDARSVHNPHIKKFAGKYYLYYIGSKDPGTSREVSSGKGLSLRDRIQQNQKIGVVVFRSFQALMKGDFERSNQPLSEPRTRVKTDNVVAPSPAGTEAKPDNLIVVNPAVVKRPGKRPGTLSL